MKKAHELTVLTGAQALLIIASDTNHIYTFATEKLRPMISEEQCRTMLHSCLSQSQPLPQSAATLGLGIGRVANIGPGLALVPDTYPSALGTAGSGTPVVCPSSSTAVIPPPGPPKSAASAVAYAGPARRRAAKPHPVPAPIPLPMPIAQRPQQQQQPPPLPPPLQPLLPRSQPPQLHSPPVLPQVRSPGAPCAIPASTPVFRAPQLPPHPVPVTEPAPACAQKLLPSACLLAELQQQRQQQQQSPQGVASATSGGQYSVAVPALVTTTGRAAVAFLPEWQPYPSDTGTGTASAAPPGPFCT